MPRFHKFIIHLEIESSDYKTLEQLQDEYNEAIEAEDYKLAGSIKKDLDKHLKSDETEYIVELEDYCYIDLDEVATFYKSEWEDGEPFTKVILKSGFELPLSIEFEQFTNLFFNLNTHGNA